MLGPDRMRGVVAVLKSIFGTDEEVRTAARVGMADAAFAIDEMRQNNQRLKEAVRPAESLDETFRQMTGGR